MRRLLPTPLVVARAERKARSVWGESEQTRRHARATMAAVVAGTAREAELEQLARRYVIESEAWDAMFWQPWSMPWLDAVSRERVLSSRAGGRPLLLSACHHGPYFTRSVVYVSMGIVPAVVAGDWWFEPPSHSMWGRRLARWRRGIPPLPVIRPRGSYAVLASLLRERFTALIYFDLPGRRETRFLGKPAMMVDGTARLALDTDALVLPVRARRDGHLLTEEVLEPLDPRDFDGVDELHQELARVHETLILEQPEAMADPAEFGWGDGISPTAWRRPTSVDGRGSR